MEFISKYIRVTDNSKLVKTAETLADTIKDTIKEKIIETLIKDSDLETKNLAEGYLADCLVRAINDPENNPVIQKFFDKLKKDIVNEVIFKMTLELKKSEYYNKDRFDEIFNWLKEHEQAIRDLQNNRNSSIW